MPEISDADLKAFQDAKAERDTLAKEKADAASAKTKADQEAKDKADKEKKEKEGTDEDPLRKKVRESQQTEEDSKKESKRIESALAFNMGIGSFVKDNADLLPAEIPEILKVAEKENYDNANQKASAIKVSFIQSFFSVKDHLDSLTSSQKNTLEDFLKLTKNGKEEKAVAIYENIFEPALETIKRVRKAEEVGKAQRGFASGTKVEDEYKNRLMAGSKKTYLGEKGKV